MEKEDLIKINEILSKENVKLTPNGDSFMVEKTPEKVYNKFFRDHVNGDWYKILSYGNSGKFSAGVSGKSSHHGGKEITSMSIDIERALDFAKNYQNELYEKTTNESAWREKHKRALCNHEKLEHYKKSDGGGLIEGDLCLDCGERLNIILY